MRRRLIIIGLSFLGALVLMIGLARIGGGESGPAIGPALTVLDGVPQVGTVLGGDSTLQITEYIDLLCDPCALQSETVIPDLIRERVARGDVAMERLVLARSGQESRALALASYAAGEQGRLWHFTEAWLAARRAGTAEVSVPGIYAIAELSGLDLERFAADLARGQERLNDLASADQRAAADKITLTPAFVVRGQGGEVVLNGIQDTAAIDRAIAEVAGP